tara:strand:+ start:8928 stop:9530 length:603 start_codon:yes stop_codon:yes gene_type:complete
MAVSAVKIANLALSNIGASSSIEAFSEATAEANATDLWYDFARQSVLAAYPWGFAQKRLTLAAHSDDPPDGVWVYRYQYPSDCLVARSIVNPSGADADAVPFEIESSDDGSTISILTDMASAVLVYTWDLETTSLWSPHFVLTLSYLIAHFIAFPLTGKKTIQQDMLREYIGLLQQADALNANERQGKPPRDADSIRARA